MRGDYIHGYTEAESLRLSNQAQTLADLLHYDTVFPPGSSVLEAGCGTGAQTVFLAKRNPEAHITAIDISPDSLKKAEARMEREGMTNVVFREGDVYHLPFDNACFDHVFVCFLLEHLDRPVEAVFNLKKLLNPGGTLTVIEGDHGSAFFYPHSEAAQKAIACQIELQARSGGNALIGRELYPLFKRAGFRDIKVSPRMVYVDASRPEFVEGFTKKTFASMIEGVRERAVTAGIIDPEVFDSGIRNLYRTAEDDGVFCYTFFKALGR